MGLLRLYQQFIQQNIHDHGVISMYDLAHYRRRVKEQHAYVFPQTMPFCLFNFIHVLIDNCMLHPTNHQCLKY